MSTARLQKKGGRAARGSHWQRHVALSWPDIRSGLDPDTAKLVQGWFCAEETNSWDMQQLLTDLGGAVRHARWTCNGGEQERRQWQSLVAELRQDVVIAVTESVPGHGTLRVWARKFERAQSEFDQIRQRYLKRSQRKDDPCSAEFYVLCHNFGELHARRIISRSRLQTARDLELHYGEGFLEWHCEFIRLLDSKRSGLTILRGDPGTGKTSYLRALMAELRHRAAFYFLPGDAHGVLASPSCAEFWLNENDRHGDKTKLVIIEDAENLLAKRGKDNQDSVGNLLNVADGLAGDALKLHIVCTVNCKIDDLDPAIVRPGRLLTAKEFRRLTPDEAQEIAKRHGLKLETQATYSLAEIFDSCRSVAQQLARPASIGFASPAQS